MKRLFDDGDLGELPRKPRWRCLPCPGSYPAAKVAIPTPPPPKRGPRRWVVADGFAGGGGASNGIEKALPRLAAAGLLPVGHTQHVTYAVNHDDAAIAMHRVNHPRTVHLPANVWQVSMRDLLGDDFFGFLWLSPDCRDHSTAKGGPITSRAVRDLAWVLVKWLKELPDWQRPWTICLENVLAFAKWSPLIERADRKGFERDPERIGWTFHQFVHEVCSYGYSAGWDEMEACKYGAPTIRKRLKLCFRRDAQPIVIPAPTHGNPKSEAVKSGALRPWPVAADIIEWQHDCPSIFLTKEEAREYTKRTGKRIIRPLAVKTHARLAYGVKRHVIDAGDDAFVGSVAHGVGAAECNPHNRRTRSISEALGTVHAGGGNFGLVVPHMMTMRNSGSPTSGADEPARTIMAGGANQFVAEAAILPHIAVFRGDSIGKPMTAPLPTPTANSFIKRPGGAAPIGVCEMAAVPFVSRGQHGGGNRPAGEPIHTIAASDGDQNQIVVPYLVPRYGEREGQAPRSVAIDRAMPTPVPDGNQGSLAAVYLAQHNNDSRRTTGVNPGRPAGVPLSTITREGSQQQVVAALMLSLKGSDRRDGSCEDPHVAVCASGQHSAVVTLPLMTAYYSSGGQHARVDAPSLTVPTKARFGLTEVEAAAPPLTEAQWARARRVAEFLREHDCWDGGEIVTLSIHGIWYIIVDIGMRMLTPRELARAQGFPDTYVLDPIFNGKPLSETEQRHKIGNSVCDEPAAAFIEANYRPPLEWGELAFKEAAE